MKAFFLRHTLAIVYFFMLVFVSTGLFYGFGFKHIPKIIIYSLAFFVFYAAISFWFKNKLNLRNIQFNLPVSKDWANAALFGFTVIFTIIHFVYLGNVPIVDALNTLDYYKIAFIRQDINNHDASLIKYISAFTVKGVIPFALLYFSIVNKRLFYWFLPVAIFYSLALMQKSLIVSVMVPTIIYALLNRKFIKAALFSFISITGVFVLVYATNPSLRASQEEIRAAMLKNGKEYNMEADRSVSESFMTASSAIYTRVFITTGLVAGHWFDNIPNKYPYAKGCGYHFLAPALGCNYDDYDYSRIIYDDTYKREAKLGLKGTVTVASFVYDYANFGYIGLIYSGLFLALFFVLLEGWYDENHKFSISINILFVFWLTSGAFTTQLVSGGWLVTMVLYKFYRRNLNF